MMHAIWDEWRRLHPNTLVLSEDTSWKRPYREPALGRAEFGRSFVSSLLRSDSRLPQSALVVGVEVDGPYGAYVLDLHEAADHTRIRAGRHRIRRVFACGQRHDSRVPCYFRKPLRGHGYRFDVGSSGVGRGG